MFLSPQKMWEKLTSRSPAALCAGNGLEMDFQVWRCQSSAHGEGKGPRSPRPPLVTTALRLPLPLGSLSEGRGFTELHRRLLGRPAERAAELGAQIWHVESQGILTALENAHTTRGYVWTCGISPREGLGFYTASEFIMRWKQN